MSVNTASVVPADVLERFMRDVFVKLGVPEADANECAEVLDYFRPAGD